MEGGDGCLAGLFRVLLEALEELLVWPRRREAAEDRERRRRGRHGSAGADAGERR